MCRLAENLDHSNAYPDCVIADGLRSGPNQSAIGNAGQTRRTALAKAHNLPRVLRQADRQRADQPRLLARCAFCSINAWYERGGGKKFRIRSVENIVAEMIELYHRPRRPHLQFPGRQLLPAQPRKAAERFAEFRDGCARPAWARSPSRSRRGPTASRKNRSRAGRAGAVPRLPRRRERLRERAAQPEPQEHRRARYSTRCAS